MTSFEEKQVIQEHFIRSYPEALSVDLCDEICRTFDEKIQKNESKKIEESYRQCHQWPLQGFSPLENRVKQELSAIFEKYKKDVPQYGNLHHCKHLEIPTVNKYLKAESHWFHTHVDCWNAQSSLRQVSLIAYLNDVESGGETAFHNSFHQSFTSSPKKGNVLLFPSNWMYPHQAKPPLSNDKYIIVAWFCFEPSFSGFYSSQSLDIFTKQ